MQATNTHIAGVFPRTHSVPMGEGEEEEEEEEEEKGSFWGQKVSTHRDVRGERKHCTREQYSREDEKKWRMMRERERVRSLCERTNLISEEERVEGEGETSLEGGEAPFEISFPPAAISCSHSLKRRKEGRQGDTAHRGRNEMDEV